MASRKKQDEKNLKTLRELGALQFNKYCFDCNQRGPTYVNVTIGSFVCTKCSGLLRGLTPPHRVKSISMATFTPEEIEPLKGRGNEYCRKVWMGLYEGGPPSENRDDQAIKDFMLEKYERKRYYMDPSQLPRNGYTRPQTTTAQEPKKSTNTVGIASDPKTIRLNNNIQYNNRKRPEVVRENEFVADFDSADIFNSSNVNNNTSQYTFANFDNNPVFGSSNQGMPTPSTLHQMNHQSQMNHQNQIPNGSGLQAEDKYAALKDLDNAFKTQNTLDWTSSSSNGSLYSSPTPSGSVYSSPSPQNSLFGSPSQGQFVNGFSSHETNGTVSNPFNGNGSSWNANTNGTTMIQHQQQPFANPFRISEPAKMNGFSQAFQSAAFQVPSNGSAWAPNPFKVGATTMNSNNPFL